MSFCSKCGAQLENENQQFCANCGAKIENGVETSKAAVDNSTEYAQQQPAQNPIYGQQVSMPNQFFSSAAPVVQHPMKWFKFLIYFALFFGAFIDFVFGFNYITGGIYFVQTNGQVTADMVYSMFGGVQVIDIVYGILMIAVAGFSIYTRFRLSKYKANGPMCLYIMYGASAGMSLLYSIALLAITGLNTFGASTIGSIIGSVVAIVLNRVYFNKRKDLFVK